MRYGYFDDKQREYVITQPDTPLPWFNYLGMEDYFGLISNTAGGYSFYRDARLRRITRYRYNNVPFDFGGRYVYLRDDSNGDYWSPSWQPTQSDIENYECRHGMGYSKIGSTYEGIEASTRYFVPQGEQLEVWEVTVKNNRDTEAELSLFASIEFALWDADDDARNFQRNFNTGEVEIENNVIYHKTEYRERRNHFAYFACSDDVHAYDTQRESFLGSYRSWDRPITVENGELSNSHAHGWSPMGAFQVKVKLAPGEERKVIFNLGYHENPKDQKFSELDVINKEFVAPKIGKFLDADNVQAAYDSLASTWEQYLGVYQVDSPDEHVNRMVNIWNAYQCMVTFNMSRSTSFFESGVGRGMGFRDSNQDLLGFVHMVPERARERVLDISATQLLNGGAYHQYQPLTKRGNDKLGGDFNDDPQWLVMGVTAYVKETGDFAILDEMVQYENKEGTEAPLYNHLERAVQYTLDRLGPNGLPLIGRADWNDCLNLNCFSDEPGESFQTTENKGDGLTAESTVIGALFTHACNEMVKLATALGKEDDVAKYSGYAAEMTAKMLTVGWDGDWFLRAYDSYGNKVGSEENQYGKIFIEPQGLAVIAGIGVESGEAAKALDSVGEHLATKHGIVLNQPAYREYELHLGEITSYPPGYKENAGIFCHTNPWIVFAEAVIGRNEKAFDYYMRICPSFREEISEVHRTEPYVYAQMIAGKDAASHGEAKNSWLTGTASWNYISITQAVLGLHPTYNGLEVKPAVPGAWDEYSVSRVFRGTTYKITFKNPNNSGSGVSSITIDGEAVEGTIIPFIAGGGTHQVEVVLS